MQIFDIISIPLLAKTTKIVQILADLGRSDIHSAAQIIGGNALYPCVQQFPKVAVITRHSPDNSLGYLFFSHKDAHLSCS